LKLESAKHPEGYVSLEVLATFNRLKALSNDISFIAKSIKNSQTLTLSEDEKSVKRTNPLPEVDSSDLRTVVATGLPQDSILDDIEKMFAQFGKVLSTRLLKNQTKTFQGRAFIEFSSEEEAKTAASQKPMFANKEITVQLKKDFFSGKKEKGKKRKRENDNQAKQNENDKKPAETEKAKIEENVILKYSGIGDAEIIKRPEIKKLFEQYGSVKFVDFRDGQKQGYVRFWDAATAKATLEAFSATPPNVAGSPLQISLLQGDEEKEYWEKNVFKHANKKGPKGGKKKRKSK